MTSDRYHSYRRAKSCIAALEERAEVSDASQILRDTAEDLLLCRDSRAEPDAALDTAAVVLLQLVVAGVISRSLAERTLDALHDCGPNPAGRSSRAAATLRRAA